MDWLICVAYMKISSGSEQRVFHGLMHFITYGLRNTTQEPLRHSLGWNYLDRKGEVQIGPYVHALCIPVDLNCQVNKTNTLCVFTQNKNLAEWGMRVSCCWSTCMKYAIWMQGASAGSTNFIATTGAQGQMSSNIQRWCMSRLGVRPLQRPHAMVPRKLSTWLTKMWTHKYIDRDKSKSKKKEYAAVKKSFVSKTFFGLFS